MYLFDKRPAASQSLTHSSNCHPALTTFLLPCSMLFSHSTWIGSFRCPRSPKN
jgi:hypothetical protein